MAKSVSLYTISPLLLMLVMYVAECDSITCTVCREGRVNTCDAPGSSDGCLCCLKQVTKVKLRDSGYINGWERVSEVVSKLCFSEGNRYIKPEGCYKQQNNGGYTERCFCYSENCNSSAHKLDVGTTSLLKMALISVVSAVTVRLLCQTS